MTSVVKQKKLKIRNLRLPSRQSSHRPTPSPSPSSSSTASSTAPSASFAADWESLSSAISAIFASAPTTHTLNGLSALVRTHLAHHAPLMYERLRALFADHIASEHKQLLAAISSQGAARVGEGLLPLIATTWDKYKRAVYLIRCVFIHLNQDLATSGIKEPIWPLARRLFRQAMFTDQQLLPVVIEQFLASLEKDRNGEAPPTTTLQAVSAMFSELQTYKECIDTPLQQATLDFYQKEAATLQASVKLPQYLSHVHKRIEEEHHRCQLYLNKSSRLPLIRIIETHLIKTQISFLERGFSGLMDEEDCPSISLLAHLMTRTHALDKLVEFLVSYIKEEGWKVIKDQQEDKTLVERLLAFKRRVDKILRESLSETPVFAAKTKDAFRHFINRRANKPAELIALFLDNLLKKGHKMHTEEAMLATIDECLILFRFIEGKDVFEGFYKDALSRRLLLDKVTSTDLELSLISKLKQVCGPAFTSNLEEMFKDINLSDELAAEFKTNREATAEEKALGEGIDVRVRVLKKASWPSYPPVNIINPPQLLAIRAQFERFYNTKFKNRKLAWQGSLGTCSVAARFKSGTKDIVMSQYQALIMLLFNAKEQLSFPEIFKRTNIEKGALKLALTSLACGKVQILKKTPKGRHVGEGDTFAVNVGFSNKLRRIKINQIQLKQTAEESEATVKKVFEDRKLSVDCAIVRIMKSRSTLAHKDLIQELMAQLRFPVRRTDLKKRIEVMLEREYMERDANDNALYHYIA